MFTGIIRHLGLVKSVQPRTGGATITIDNPDVAKSVRPGDSVAVNGVCLTVTQIIAANLTFDVVAETIRRTTLGHLRPASKVHLETSLRVGDSIDGHFVQGHVDGVITLAEKQSAGNDVLFWFAHDAGLKRLLPEKGSVAIDGVSLTIAKSEDLRFAVALIPTTLTDTNFGRSAVGDRFNLETDIITRAVVHNLDILNPGRHSVTLATLRQEGFA
jgi:riboflavin synthase